jgi:hypothetical protein
MAMTVNAYHAEMAVCTIKPMTTTRYTLGWCFVMSIVVWRRSFASGMLIVQREYQQLNLPATHEKVGNDREQGNDQEDDGARPIYGLVEEMVSCNSHFWIKYPARLATIISVTHRYRYRY